MLPGAGFFVDLPKEIQNVTYIYEVNRDDIFRIGTTPIATSVELGQNQAYMPSFIQAIADYGVFRVTVESFSTMMNSISKMTVQYKFNNATNKLVIQTTPKKNMMLETYVRVPPEKLYENDLFYRYVVAQLKIRMAELAARYDFNLLGGGKFGFNDLYTRGDKEIEKIELRIKELSQTPNWFWMVRR